MPLAVLVNVYVGWVGSGTGSTMVGQDQARVGGQGQYTAAQITALGPPPWGGPAGNPHAVFVGQNRFFNDFEPVPIAVGSEGTVTLANIKAAIDTASAAIAGAGNPKIDPDALADIQGWASGQT